MYPLDLVISFSSIINSGYKNKLLVKICYKLFKYVYNRSDKSNKKAKFLNHFKLVKKINILNSIPKPTIDFKR